MPPIRSVILEDNISYVWDYEMILSKLDVKVDSVYKSWKLGIADIKKNPPDFMIVDLLLENNENGLDFIEQISHLFIPMIVCTGYPEDEYLQKALEQNVLALFSKPLDKSALTYGIKKLVKKIEEDRSSKQFLIIRVKGVNVKVPYKNILKVAIDGNYSYVFTTAGKKYILKVSLKKMLQKLDPEIFQRCHRSTVVNVNYISSMDTVNNSLMLSNGESVEIGNNFKSNIKEVFLANKP